MTYSDTGATLALNRIFKPVAPMPTAQTPRMAPWFLSSPGYGQESFRAIDLPLPLESQLASGDFGRLALPGGRTAGPGGMGQYLEGAQWLSYNIPPYRETEVTEPEVVPPPLPEGATLQADGTLLFEDGWQVTKDGRTIDPDGKEWTRSEYEKAQRTSQMLRAV